MGKLTIDLPEELIAAINEQSQGHLEEFIQEAIESALDVGAPESVTVRSHEELIRKLEEGLASGPGRPLTEADFERWHRIACGEEKIEDRA